MNNFTQFDKILIQLAKEINESPESAEQIIQETIENSECPYFKEKAKGYTNALLVKKLVIK